MERIEQAIILNGPGRSGTTLLYQILAYHEDLAWMSSYNNFYPNIPWLAFLNFTYNNKLFGIDWNTVKKAPKPAEAYGFWEYFFREFNSTSTNENLRTISRDAERSIKTINTIVKWQRGSRFLTKITGTPRIEYLNQVFNEDYKLVWIERDPRVVVSSIMKQKWFYKSKPYEYDRLTEEEKIKFYASYYKKLHASSAIYSQKILVRYEDLVSEKLVFFEKLSHSLDLKLTPKFKQIVENWPIREVGWDHYKKHYSEAGNKLLAELLTPEMDALGYN